MPAEVVRVSREFVFKVRLEPSSGLALQDEPSCKVTLNVLRRLFADDPTVDADGEGWFLSATQLDDVRPLGLDLAERSRELLLELVGISRLLSNRGALPQPVATKAVVTFPVVETATDRALQFSPWPDAVGAPGLASQSAKDILKLASERAEVRKVLKLVVELPSRSHGIVTPAAKTIWSIIAQKPRPLPGFWVEDGSPDETPPYGGLGQSRQWSPLEHLDKSVGDPPDEPREVRYVAFPTPSPSDLLSLRPLVLDWIGTHGLWIMIEP